MTLGRQKTQCHSFEKFKIGKILHWYIFSMVSESKFDVIKFYNWQDYFLTAESQLEIPFWAKNFLSR